MRDPRKEKRYASLDQIRHAQRLIKRTEFLVCLMSREYLEQGFEELISRDIFCGQFFVQCQF